ncbi:Pleckstrin homology domain-containing family G member 1 [Camelus dromedarius]|uniref:Pleckstrin homology domain-containing family G member 1 n=1 Tax=Camelus dromedarius TaxID=9838 RepID=A0A5N4DX30_CAMDR|nr:Pleckstrin homology domain-containing family G member 1 [Camelus dromedarius]
MELSDSDRPISFGSTSSSASSRDSHGSFGSRMTLVSNSHLGLFPQDKDAGAIKLELIPARPFSSSELQRDSAAGPQNTDQAGDRQPRAQRRVEANAATKMGAESATSPKLLYVDRVVQEILETERTYVQDLKSIVEFQRIRGKAEVTHNSAEERQRRVEMSEMCKEHPGGEEEMLLSPRSRQKLRVTSAPDLKKFRNSSD